MIYDSSVRVRQQYFEKKREFQFKHKGVGGGGWPQWEGVCAVVNQSSNSVSNSQGLALSSGKSWIRHFLELDSEWGWRHIYVFR